jgi:hypothetical protein
MHHINVDHYLRNRAIWHVICTQWSNNEHVFNGQVVSKRPYVGKESSMITLNKIVTFIKYKFVPFFSCPGISKVCPFSTVRDHYQLLCIIPGIWSLSWQADLLYVEAMICLHVQTSSSGLRNAERMLKWDMTINIQQVIWKAGNLRCTMRNPKSRRTWEIYLSAPLK